MQAPANEEFIGPETNLEVPAAAPPKLRGFAGNVLLTTWTNAVISLLGVGTGTFAARILGPEGRGDLAVIQVWPTLIASIAVIGLPEALVYFSARDRVNAGRYVGSTTVLALVSTCIASVIAGYLLPTLMFKQSASNIAASRWYLLLGPVQVILTMPFYAIRGLGQIGTWNVLRILPTIAWAAVLAVGYTVGRCQPPFLAAAHLVGLAVLIPIVAIVVSRAIPKPFWPSVRSWPAIARYAVPSFGTMVPQLLNVRLVPIVLAALLPARALGFYVVALAWSATASPLLQAVGVVLFPRVASQTTRADQAAAFSQGARIATVVALATTALVVAATPWVMPLLFGPQFVAALPAAFILVGVATVTGINLVLEEGLRGLGELKTIILAEFTGLGILAGALFLLVPHLGILGAALGSLMGSIATTAVLAHQSRGHSDGKASSLLIPKTDDLRLVWQHVENMTVALKHRLKR